MERDKLEKYITENRDQLDNREPREGLWNNIKQRSGIGATSGSSVWWKVAAVFFFATSVGLGISTFYPQENQQVASETQSTEFLEVEEYYHTVINKKRDLITDLTEELILGDQAERDLNRLNAMYEVLREEFEQNPSKKVADAMILNLLVRIDILNDELQVADEASDVAI